MRRHWVGSRSCWISANEIGRLRQVQRARRQTAEVEVDVVHRALVDALDRLAVADGPGERIVIGGLERLHEGKARAVESLQEVVGLGLLCLLFGHPYSSGCRES